MSRLQSKLQELHRNRSEGSVTLPNRARNKSPGTSGSRRSDDFTPDPRKDFFQCDRVGTAFMARIASKIMRQAGKALRATSRGS
jgi:hypothetical protein